MNASAPIDRQLSAYNARDLAAFIAEYSDDIQVFRPPATEPLLSGKAAFAAHYASKRFNLPNLHAQILNRIVVGNTVADHERITGIRAEPLEAIAVYEVSGDLIRKVWLYYSD